MKSAIVFLNEDNDKQKTQQPKSNTTIGMNYSNLVNTPIKIPVGNDISTTSVQEFKKKKPGRPKKETRTLSDGTEIVLASEDQQELSLLQSNAPYEESYNETNNMLKSAIMQADIMTNDIQSDISEIRLSKTLKKKYDYVSLLASTSSALLSTKVGAIRELNKSITDCHNLELKRFKDLKLGLNEVDDDKKIMDMYNAFISAPVGGHNGFMPSPVDLTVGSNMVTAALGNSDSGYLNYLNNLTPEQNNMRFEGDPNVKTVVVYDKSTGRRWFDVMNILTGESIPNTSKPDSMFLEDTTIDIRNNIARNTNLDTTYPLMVIGNSAQFEY